MNQSEKPSLYLKLSKKVHKFTFNFDFQIQIKIQIGTYAKSNF